MITINVNGIPRPGGSKSAFANRKTGKIIIAPANKNTAVWRKEVQRTASEYKGNLLTGELHVEYIFRLPRPKLHFGSGKNKEVLKTGAPWWHTVKPDLTKLVRSTEDALTGIIWKDDCQVALSTHSKRYCAPDERPGALIVIKELF